MARVFSAKGRGGKGERCLVICALCRILKTFKLHRDFFASSSFLKLKFHGTFQNCKNSRHLSKVVPRTCSRIFSVCCAKKAVQQQSTQPHSTRAGSIGSTQPHRRLNQLCATAAVATYDARTRMGSHGRIHRHQAVMNREYSHPFQ